LLGSEKSIVSVNSIIADSEIEIDTVGTYSVTVTSAFGCETTTQFNVTESESAIIEFTETIDFSDPNNVTITISGIGNIRHHHKINGTIYSVLQDHLLTVLLHHLSRS